MLRMPFYAFYYYINSIIICQMGVVCVGAEWYHGDAFGLDPNKLRKVMGFRCHICRGKSAPGLPCGQLELHGGSQSASDKEEETKNASPLPLAFNSKEANLKGKGEEEVREPKNASPSPPPLVLSSEEVSLKRKEESHLMKEETSDREIQVYRRAKQHSSASDRVMMGGDDDIELSSSVKTKKPSSSSSNDGVEAEGQQVAKKQKTSLT